MRFCRHIVQGKSCERRRCPYVHDLEIKIPCPYSSCKFGPAGVCVYQHKEEDFLGKVEDLNGQLVSHLELMWSYQFSKFKWEIQELVKEKLNRELCLTMPRVENPMVIQVQKFCISKQWFRSVEVQLEGDDTNRKKDFDDKVGVTEKSESFNGKMLMQGKRK